RRGGSLRAVLDTFQQRFAAIENADFFGSAGRDRVVVLFEQMKARLQDAPAPAPQRHAGTTPDPQYARRVWVTRPRPGIDRVASAWLIRRFIDPQARFAFAQDSKAAAKDALPFDMFGVEFSHHGDRCTFETLQGRFSIDARA